MLVYAGAMVYIGSMISLDMLEEDRLEEAESDDQSPTSDAGATEMLSVSDAIALPFLASFALFTLYVVDIIALV